MTLSIKPLLLLLSATLALGAASLAPAQTQTFPTSKGNNQRIGNNGNPTVDNPAAANLQWFAPNATIYNTLKTLRTNTSNLNPAPIGTWSIPVVGGAAQDAYIYYGGAGNPLDGQIGINKLAPYAYATAIPSDQSGDPRVPLAGYGPASVFTFNVTPLTATPQDLALFASIPVGPTYDAAGNATFPPEFVVFEIDYGNGQSYVDVVDRFAAGSGFIRLGNGGKPSSVEFHYDGVHPILIKVFNTIPRDSTGALAGVYLNPGSGLPAFPYYVYANAAEATQDYGSAVSSPVLGTDTAGANAYVFNAVNLHVSTEIDGKPAILNQGQVSAYNYAAPGAQLWNFSPVDAGGVGFTLDAPSANIVATPGWSTGNAGTYTGFQGFAGASYFYMPVTNNLAAYDQVVYSPTLSAGSYDVLLWLPGQPSSGTFPTFSKSVMVEVDEGATKNLYTVDLTQSNGYVQVGGRKFVDSVAEPLAVKITNYDANAGDAGQTAYADAVRFVGSANLAIDSTPAQAIVPVKYTYDDPTTGAPVTTTQNRSVVVVCGEDGRIYCLDAQGHSNGAAYVNDGTTDVLWAYPSIPDQTNPNWHDPNDFPVGPDGKNGTTSATMPSGFGLTSPLIQEVPVGSGHFYCFVGSSNGRVYCIDMTGRGDGNLTTRTPGTTTRVWTYPDDYRPDDPSIPPKGTALGAFSASLVYSANASGPTIYVPSSQGRMYALNAAGDPAKTTTTVEWTYPKLTAPVLGPIYGTPAIDGTPNSLYFGTEMLNGAEPGQFFSLNPDTGAVNWTFAGTAAIPTDNFDSGPCTAFNNLVGDGNNYIFAANQNGFIYAFDPAGNVLWQSNELQTTVSQPLMFTNLTVFDNAGNATATPVPIVMVPGDDGFFWGLYASKGSVNIQNLKLAYGYEADGDRIYSGMASGHQYMYGSDDHGYLYGFSAGDVYGGGGIAGPGGFVYPPNSPEAQDFSSAQAAFYLESSYETLRANPAPDYLAATAPANFLNRVPPTFDFGEVIYVFVYDFPYQENGATTQVTFTAHGAGITQRTFPVQAQQFATNAPAKKDGFAVLVYPVVTSNQNPLVPGPADFTFAFNSAGNDPNNGRSVNNIVVTEASDHEIDFELANPLGIAMRTVGAYGEDPYSLGSDLNAFPNPNNPQNLFNGSPNNSSITPNPASLILPWDPIPDGQTASATMYVFDRSLMATLNGPGMPGITNIRASRQDLAWNGGYAAVVKPFGGPNGLYAGSVPALETIEDLPTQFPNVSLDYGNIQRQFVSVTSDPQGTPANPLFSSVSLLPPNGLYATDANGNLTGQLNKPSTWGARTPNPTPFELDTAVPRYQAANLSSTIDTNNDTVGWGYSSPINIFTDPSGSGILQLGGGQRSVYRSFGYGGQVAVDEHMSVVSPSIDLGELAEGAGLMLPQTIVLPSTVRSPWMDLALPKSNQIYQSFQAVNDGNVNLLNVRIGHMYNNAGVSVYPGWPIYASLNDDLSYLDGGTFMWSDLDPYFSATGQSGLLPRGEVLVQKPRTTSVSGMRVTSNLVRLPNSNLGNAGGDPLVASFPANGDPRIGITPPIGFPAGSYSQIVRLVEDRVFTNPASIYNYDLSLELSTETFADPTFTLNFTVDETRLTNSSSANVAPLADNLVPAGPAPAFLDANIEPTGMRDRRYGNVLMGWASNRPNSATGLLNTASDTSFRLYFGSLVGGSPLLAPPNGQETGSPLNDLAYFGSANANQWYSLLGPYPLGASLGNGAALDALFGVAAGSHVVGSQAGDPDTVRFDHPSLPSPGLINPFQPTQPGQDFNQALFAFTGSATVQTPTGRVDVNKLFVGTATPQSGGPAALGGAVGSPNNPDQAKSRPSVVQVGANQAAIFYAATGTGAGHLFYELYNNGAFSNAIPLDTGTGFDTVTGVSAFARTYDGADPADVAANRKMIELAFSAKLRSRSNSEIFLARVPTDANGAPDKSNSANQYFSYFDQRVAEQLSTNPQGVAGGSAGGSYQAQGVAWNVADINAIDVGVGVGDAAPTSIVQSRAYDPSTGILSLQTTMGTVYADTTQGTVRFAATKPGNDVRVYATYQPQFLRASDASGSTLRQPNLLWDDRLVGSSNYNGATGTMYDRYWYAPNGAHAKVNSARSDRYVALYDRSAVGPGQSARPLMTTLRLGVQLPGAVPTLANGDVDPTKFQVLGALGDYQVDPSNGRVYFSTVDEDRTLTVRLNGVPATYVVTLVTERTEAPVLIERAIDETQTAAFIDPFDVTKPGTFRPDLMWLLWSSTRAGASDVYFETLAPLLWPIRN